MRRLRSALLVFAGALVIVALAGGYGNARASNTGPGGARIRVGDELVGPYRLLLTSAPDPAPVGTLTLLAHVTDPQNSKAVRDANIKATLVGSNGKTLAAVLTHDNAGNPTDYVAHMEIDQPGDYNVSVEVSGPAGTATVSFTQNISSPRSTSTLLIAGIPFLILLAGLGGWWFLRSGTRAAQAAQ